MNISLTRAGFLRSKNHPFSKQPRTTSEGIGFAVIPFCPVRYGKNLGLAYDEFMHRLHDNDWACFIDHDACFTTPDWYKQIESIVEATPHPCILTAWTNRIGCRWQQAPGVDRTNHSMTYHRDKGREFAQRFGTRILDVTKESLMSGVVIVLSKRTWRLIGGFSDGFLGVDNKLHRSARDRGVKVYLMKGVYVYHWYRADQ